MEIYKKAVAAAPASIANLGSGFDRVGLSFPYVSFWDTVSVTINKDIRGLVLDKDSFLSGTSVNPDKNIATVAVRAVLDRFVPGWEKSLGGVKVKVLKGVPVGYGLGSSAASAVAGIISAAAMIGKINQLRLSEVIGLAGEIEVFSAGAVHYDNVAASLLGGFVTIIAEVKGGVRLEYVHKLPDWGVAVFLPERPKRSTKTARAVLPRNVLLLAKEKSLHASLAMIDALDRQDLDGFISIVESDDLVTPRRLEFYGKETYAKAILAAKSAAQTLGVKATVGLSGAGPSLFVIAETARKALPIAMVVCSVFGKGNIYTHEFSSAGAKLVSLEAA